ncbi:MAG: SurA N-terminal domain-containing protein, partial [OM182 bacterium]
MLQDIRDNSQGVIAKVIIGLIVAIFVLFGAESIIGGLTRAPGIAEVNGEEISD